MVMLTNFTDLIKNHISKENIKRTETYILGGFNFNPFPIKNRYFTK